MNEHIMTKDQEESHSQWLTLWKLMWLASLGTVIYSFITPTFGEDWMWLFAVFLVTFMLGAIFKGFADDVAMGRNDTVFALVFIFCVGLVVNAKFIFSVIIAIAIMIFADV